MAGAPPPRAAPGPLRRQRPRAFPRWRSVMGVGMRVMVLGGDGFCGWPTSLYLSDRGHDVTIVDNLSRRKIDVELEVESLTPIRSVSERLRVWRDVSGHGIEFVNLDLATEYDRLVAVLEQHRPEAIVHFAEQRAAPYSMRSTHTKRYTVDNNVCGTQTDQTSRDERLINRFDYDGDYGTVLNRFLMQAAIGHPLTVHGTGGQTRAFIHIRDTVRCIEIAVTNPPEDASKPRVLNQMTETHRVLDLAKMVADVMGADIAYLPNPRREAEENDLNVRNDQFLALGLKPTTLSEGLLAEGREIAARYRGRADPSKIVCRSVWRAGMETADDLVTELPAQA